MRHFATASLLAAALLAAGCAPVAPPDRSPDIRGSIQTVTAGGGDPLGSILVVGEKQADTGYDRASVAVDRETLVLVRGPEGWTESRFEDLAAGDVVEAWFTGPVAESYPVQATAEAVAVYP